MNLLITGNLGYIGPVLTKYFLDRSDIQIYGLDIGWFEPEVLSKNFINHKIKQKIKDIRDIDLIDLENIDAVIHLAAISNDPMGKEFALPTMQINLDASIKLIQKCHEAGINKFVFASSCSVYGSLGIESKKEDDDVNPITEYAISKIKFENYLKEFSQKSDIQISCLRFSTAAGPSPRIRLDLVLNDFVTSALINNEIKILSNGDPVRPIIDVEDMCRAFDWTLQRDGSNFEVYNVGLNVNNMTVLEMAELVESLIPSTKIIINKYAAPDKRSYRVNFDKFNSKISNELALKHDTRSIIIRLITQLENNLDNLQNFRESFFIRHNKLKQLKNIGYLDNQLRIIK